ncbi:MAG TPA: hydrogenase nickel incorporation protein HypB, partial [bacterium]|nr:hydrogenase nickel incorporation protein HypB [bacterium]
MEIKVLKKVLAANDKVAVENKSVFDSEGITVINLMSSPGSGKTFLLDKTIGALKKDYGIAVIEGDITTTLDAERLKRHDVPIVQINTSDIGGDCHLEATMINSALKDIDTKKIDILFIENVGNLVCPAEFELGEDHKTVVLSVTEGEDKPLKYPLMFQVCNWAVISKTDLAPILETDMAKLRGYLKQVNPKLEIFE